MKLKSTLTLLLMSVATLSAKNALPELKDSEIPKTFQELWQDIDPRAEPLEPEILKEWEEDGVVIQVLRINVAKVGDKYLKVAGVYGYPKGAKNLPALLHTHGGGQSAHANTVITNAKRGYATFSLAWAGRIISSQYNVKADNLKAFWDNDISNEKYMVSTNWQNIDAYHAPSRWGRSSSNIAPSEHTLDKLESPRNVMWFLWTLAGRRALTFLEQQPQVDPDKLGVYGHSMGGKITVLVAGSDDRIKVAIPSCGGANTNPSTNNLYINTVDDMNYIKNIKAPILYLAPANDFNAHINDISVAIDNLKIDTWRTVATPYKSHRDDFKGEISTLLFADNHLKNSFKFPASPELSFDIKGGEAKVLLKVDSYNTENIDEVELYYSFQGNRNDRELNKQRFWHYLRLEKTKDGIYEGTLPVFFKNKPLWLYGNVTYNLNKDYTFAGYSCRTGTTNQLLVSSQLKMFEPDAFASASIKDTASNPMLLDSAKKDWKKEFFSYDSASWDLITNKLSDAYYAPSEELLIEVVAEKDAAFVITLDEYAKEIKLSASDKVQSFKLKAQDFKNSDGDSLLNFEGLNVLKLVPTIRLNPVKTSKTKKSLIMGSGKNREVAPIFKTLKWI